jgi:hypothetical protein
VGTLFEGLMRRFRARGLASKREAVRVSGLSGMVPPTPGEAFRSEFLGLVDQLQIALS